MMLWAHAVSRKDGSPADGLHLLWAPPAEAGYSVDGFDIWRRKHRESSEPVCHRLTSTELDQLHTLMSLSTPVGEIGLRISPQSDGPVGAYAYQVYTFDFSVPRDMIEIQLFAPSVLAVAFRGPKAVAVESFDPSVPQTLASFRHRGADRVAIYAVDRTESLIVCRNDRRSPAEEEQDWQNAELIAQGLQLPFQEVQSGVGSVQEELDLVLSRLVPGEDLGNGDFKTLSVVMNEALSVADVTPPPVLSGSTRADPADPFVEFAPWGYGLGLGIDAMWRRALGLGYLDPGSGLAPGASYDYRIVGRFRRRDLEERLLGFHTVPNGARLPSAFHLGTLRLTSNHATVVRTFPEPELDVLQHQGRKGISIAQRLTLEFAVPVTVVVLELEPDAPHDLEYKAIGTELIPGLPAHTETGSVPPDARVEVSFSQPIDRLELNGQAFFYGLRISSLPAGTNPNETVSLAVVVSDVAYVETQPPAPPPSLSTENLQIATPPGGAPAAPHGLGFQLRWQPPNTPPFWPDDLDAAPPFEEMAFEVERRRSDTGDPYGPLDPGSPPSRPTWVGGGRQGAPEVEPIRYGADLLELYPEQRRPTPPVPLDMELQDVLTSDRFPNGPPPGSEHQYRIYSLDLTGRRSATATEGPRRRLEKHEAPPLPVGPPPGPDPQALRPVGVQARVLQAADPELGSADLALLDGHDNAVVLEWGWGPEERRKDPLADELRVYWQSIPPDLLIGRLTGTAVWDGNHFRMSAELSRAVGLDELTGLFIETGEVGGRAFRVASNDAGATVELRLLKSPADEDAVPAAGRFTLAPGLDGSELRPAAWEERLAVLPITAEESYRFVVHDRLALSAETPRARIWMGVSAADSESYVADELPAGAPNGDRPGNESSIVAAVAEARYRGRPAFSPPPPLADVPETVLPEADGESLLFELDIQALLPQLQSPAGRRFMVERLSVADLASRLSATAGDQISVRLFDRSSSVYELPNSQDQAAFLAAIRSGRPAQIANKFLMDAVIRLPTELDPLWQKPDGTEGVEPVAVTRAVPNKAERYLYRLRLVDAAGHSSVETALVPRVFRVPSRRVPGVPELRSVSPAGDRVEVELTTEDSFDLAGALIFSIEGDAAQGLDGSRQKPRLIRVPGRPDLYPQNGIRLRLDSGEYVAPQFLDRSLASADAGRLTFEHELVTGFFKRVVVWAVAVTRDGVPSWVAGPQVVVTPESPAAVPPLTLTATGGLDQASWPAETSAVDLALERSVDNGGSWRRLTPWLSAGVAGQREFPSPTGPRLYRLVSRNRGGGLSPGDATPLPDPTNP